MGKIFEKVDDSNVKVTEDTRVDIAGVKTELIRLIDLRARIVAQAKVSTDDLDFKIAAVQADLDGAKAVGVDPVIAVDPGVVP